MDNLDVELCTALAFFPVNVFPHGWHEEETGEIDRQAISNLHALMFKANENDLPLSIKDIYLNGEAVCVCISIKQMYQKHGTMHDAHFLQQMPNFGSTNEKSKFPCLIVFCDVVVDVEGMTKVKPTDSHSENVLSLDELWTCGY